MFTPAASLFCLLLVVTGGKTQDQGLSGREVFTTDLIKVLGSSGENVVFSPVSLDTALSMVALGAKGETRSELFSTMGYRQNDAKQAIAQKQSNLSEKPAPGAIWQSANRIMVAPDLNIRKDYVQMVRETFPNTAVTNFNFNNPVKTSKEVNSWVAEKTNNVIKELFRPEMLNPRTRMIILNAVYFKGEWKNGFDKKRTKKECFFSTPGKCTMTDMMHIKEDFKYGYHNDLKAQIIELPYKNDNFSMVVVLPDEKYGNLNNLLGNLDVDQILAFIDEKKYPLEVHLTVPRFEIEFFKEMRDPLKKMGIKTMFSDGADLSGMVDGEKAVVSTVIHKAKITCDEEGTVAAASTGIGIVPLSLALSDLYFVANQPFLFIIRQKNPSAALFAGIFKTA